MGESRFASVRRSVVLGALSALGLVLSASSAQAAVTLSAEAAAAFDVKVVTPTNLPLSTDVAVLPDGRLVVTQKNGDVLTFPAGSLVSTKEHIEVEDNHDERGLLGVVIDPNFATNQYIYFYASMTNDQNNRHQVLRYKLSADSKLSDQKILVSMGLMGPANHNGGAIDIYQGNLYIGVGDTGANATPPQNRFGTCLNHLNGKVLRVSAADGQPPADNPLMNVDMATACDGTGSAFTMGAPQKAIYGWGFRNPFRLWVDKTNGKVWVGDVGESTKEEITIAQMGKHHGYPFQEGTKDWAQGFAPAGECQGVTPASACIAPVYDYDHSDGNNCVIGGRILDGCDWPAAWKSRYVFGDDGSGNIWTLDVNATRDGVVANSRKDFAKADGTSLTSIRMGSDNALYIVEKSRVSRVTAKGNAATANSCPAVNGESGMGLAGSGSGGAANGGAATGGSNASGGNAPAGGNGNPAAGSGNASGGTNNGTGGSAGGSSSTAGADPGNAGAAGSAGSSDSGGCGCHVVGGTAASGLGLGVVALALAASLRRRRARQSRH
jgi:MYXO-CTERM domain-containing protein